MYERRVTRTHLKSKPYFTTGTPPVHHLRNIILKSPEKYQHNAKEYAPTLSFPLELQDQPTNNPHQSALSNLLSSTSSTAKSNRGPPPPYDSHPPMSSTREPKAVGGQMTEGVGVSRIKPKESKLEKFRRYVREDAQKQAQGDIWGGVKGMNGHG